MKIYRIFPIILQALIWIPCRLFFKFFVRIHIEGTENLRLVSGGPLLFASNHVSELDAVFIRSCLPFFWKGSGMFYVSRPPEFYKKGFGWRKYFYGGVIFKIWGAYPAYPGTHIYHESLRDIEEILKDGNSVTIFPEGKRSFDGVIHEARGGVSYLSYSVPCPIVPTRIKGFENATLKSLLSRKHSVTVVYGKPIFPQELFGNSTPVVNNTINNFREASVRVVERIHSL
ncbi:MAG: 1-acyl-sn-glycerol-3-phosphate acyltransferase, 1-acyl-sn-glycerol-3-phosphate acyltransferase [Candidatus Parcubacteria bacterium]|jgi:1-acyl-sn-glycerol-3-phosphate acyltransferase